MLGFAARLIGGMFTPLIDQASASTARLLRKLALFLAAGLALVVVLIALTIAFDLWIASMKGPIVGALAVAGLYLVVAVIAVVMALRPGAKTQPAAERKANEAGSTARRGLDAQVDEFAAPLLDILQNLGLRREQLAVLAGTSVAKQIGPIPLVGLAIVAGFLIGRMGGGLKGLLSSDLLSTLLASDLFAALFGAKAETPPSSDEAMPDGEARDAA
jgi:hypothetical protein